MDQDNVNSNAMSLILGGCKLARELESSLPGSLATRPGLVGKICDDIAKIFGSAKARLLLGEQGAGDDADAHFQEWLRCSYSQDMDVIQTQFSGDQRTTSRDMGVLVGGGSVQVQTTDVSGSGQSVVAPPISQRPRKRKDNAEERTMRVAAPRIGNTEIPPEDGNTWRKYGQKEILGSRFPRSYYRCTHQKLYQCPAKKQVQRLDDDPYTFEVSYRGNHTCHMSSTAPSVPPPALQGGGGSSSGKQGREMEYPVADMADAMFNSGSSTTNSIDLIFTSMMEDKWDQTNNKN